MPNTNCLAGMKCHCGSEGPFLIGVTLDVEISDDGCGEHIGDMSFDDGAKCICRCCNRMGVVGDFRQASEEGLQQ